VHHLQEDFEDNYLVNNLQYLTKVRIRELSKNPSVNFSGLLATEVEQSVDDAITDIERDFSGFDLSPEPISGDG